MLENKNELSVYENDRDAYCSMPMNTLEERKLVAKALESSDVLLNDCVGQKINLVGVYTEKKFVVKVDDKKNPILDDQGKEQLVPKYRTILFDEDGKTYATASYGVNASVKSLFFVYGTPDQWLAPIQVTVIKQKLKDGKTSLKLDY